MLVCVVCLYQSIWTPLLSDWIESELTVLFVCLFFTIQGFQGIPGHPGPTGERGTSGPVGPTVRPKTVSTLSICIYADQALTCRGCRGAKGNEERRWVEALRYFNSTSLTEKLNVVKCKFTPRCRTIKILHQ